MRITRSSFLCAVILGLFANAHSSSLQGVKRHHAHARQHVGANVAKVSSARVGERDPASGYLSVDLINNFDSDNIHVYIQTGSHDGAVMITSDGSVYKPVANGNSGLTTIPQNANCGIRLGPKGSSVAITMPVQFLSGRIYVSDGELSIGVFQAGPNAGLQNPAFQNPYDPNFNTSFGFVEANQAGQAIWTNPTYVDFVGLPLGMELVTDKDSTLVTGLPGSGVEDVCGQLADEQNNDGYPWGELCLKDNNGRPVRVLSPMHNPDGFKAYFDDYIGQVWQYITSNGIRFALVDGTVSCHIQGDSMSCDRTSLPFAKPTSMDIWGCNSGPFAQTGDGCHDAIGARFCAAFHRATFLLSGGDIQPGQDPRYV